MRSMPYRSHIVEFLGFDLELENPTGDSGDLFGGGFVIPSFYPMKTRIGIFLDTSLCDLHCKRRNGRNNQSSHYFGRPPAGNLDNRWQELPVRSRVCAQLDQIHQASSGERPELRPQELMMSSHPGETGHASQKKHRNTSGAREKSRANQKKALPICGAGRESQKRPTQVVDKKPYGKCQLT